MKSKYFTLLLVCISTLSFSSCVDKTKEKKLYEKNEDIYKSYDSTYSNKKYIIRKIDSLKDRDDFINGMDASFVEAITEKGYKYHDYDGNEKSAFEVMKDSGVNTIRLRIFHDYNSPSTLPYNGDLGRDNVFKMAKEVKDLGMKLILDFHYSDTWADPAHQEAPYAWKEYTLEQTKEALYQYTKDTIKYFNDNGAYVDYCQVGNEIDSGICFPFGQVEWDGGEKQEETFNAFADLLKAGCKGVRDASPNTKIIIHTAGALETYEGRPEKGLWFFREVAKRNLDFDVIGSSYYSYLGKAKISSITNSINTLTAEFNKKFMLMEYSYAYTLEGSPIGHNLFNSSHVQDGYPATIQGQTNQMVDIIEQVANASNSLGTCYWGGEWIPAAGVSGGSTSSADGGNYANQALFTYFGIPLPSLSVYKYIY